MSKHTPGPWHIAGDSDGTMITANFAKQIALWPPQSGEIEQCANARLIAAAPDLVSQLQQCVRYLADLNGSQWIKGTDAGSIDMRQRAIALQKMAFSAIAKATEGQP